jgi:hypothetical protein
MIKKIRNWWTWVFIHMCFVDSVVKWGIVDKDEYYYVSVYFYKQMVKVTTPKRRAYSRRIARVRKWQALDTKYLGL